MSTLISLSIDVTKVTKENLGKGKYLNLTIAINDETNNNKSSKNHKKNLNKSRAAQKVI